MRSVSLLLTGLGLLLGLSRARAAEINRETLDRWSAPYRNWYYHPDHVIPAEPRIPGYEKFRSTDVPTVFQLPGDEKWYMSFIAFDGKGYNSFVAESTKSCRNGVVEDIIASTRIRHQVHGITTAFHRTTDGNGAGSGIHFVRQTSDVTQISSGGCQRSNSQNQR